MSQPATGSLTFLFTDIEGSTSRWEHQREAMQLALERHDELLRQAIEAAGGRVFKTVGDAFCAVFDTAAAGLAAAVDAQRAVAGENWSAFGADFAPIAVRMGLHQGGAAERGGDYFGQHVNRVARIQAAGHGGQILLSSTMRVAVEATGLAAELSLRDLGEHRLKDLRHSERLAQVVVPGLPDVTRAPRTAGALSARDRIQVLAAAGRADPTALTVVARTPPETLAAIEAAVLGNAPAVVLTGEQLQAAARHRPTDWRHWRLGRIAEWSQPRYRLDGRFVGLTLLIDQGEDSASGRWAERGEPFDDLGALLQATRDPAIVVLGPPGGGKSTLLRRLELDMAIAGLRGEADGDWVTFFVSLSTYAPVRPGDPPPDPAEWLAAAWRARYPDLPPLDEALAAGGVTLLLDALNEMPATGEREFRTRVQLWKAWLQALVAARPRARAVFTCRSLDYSQPLSTPELRVPQVRIEPLSDAQVKDFLALYSPGRWREVWAALDQSPQLDVLRSPYFLALLVEQVEASGEMPEGRAGLFTGFVRQALRREVERGSALFEGGEAGHAVPLLTDRDLRRIAQWRWKGPYDLPDRGPLISKLARLAHAMQEAREDGGASQVRIDYDEALGLLDSPVDDAIVKAGTALAVLDEDEAAGEVMYVHQLVQEYFAARELAVRPDPERWRREWRAAAIRPTVAEAIAGLDAADPLPPLPGTGWEETTILAAAMAPDPPAFLREVMTADLALAARAAAQPELRRGLPAGLLDELRRGLVERVRSRGADLRERIACGLALGDLGDPRFQRRAGPNGDHLVPPLVAIPGGAYPIGADEPIVSSVAGVSATSRAHEPRHVVALAPFRLGRFPVTNAEWACFMAGGGYDDDAWWGTMDARRWRRGELANEGAKVNNREYRDRFLADPALFDQMVDQGRFANDEVMERWRGWVTLDDAAFEQALDARWRARRETEPAFWRDGRYNRPSQPVVGVSWYEASAYCRWLSAQSGVSFRLPSEVEWEAAAGGREGRPYPWGHGWWAELANSQDTRLKRTSPIGAFAGGDSPEGISDLAGNVVEWTGSLFGEAMEDEVPDFRYPYDPSDGREDPEASPRVRRVVRGGSWHSDRAYARVAYRDYAPPDYRDSANGFRLAAAP